MILDVPALCRSPIYAQGDESAEDASASSSKLSASSSGPLERGKACLRCRRRKMKCDGVRPMCAQCVRADEVECEYTDGGPTASQLLEQNVAHLEARIRELEGRSSESITLFDPHAAFSQARNRPATEVAVTGGERAANPSDRWQIPEILLNSFVAHALSFGVFLNMPRFLARLSAASEENPLPPVISYAVHLVGLVTCRDSQFKNQETQILSLLIQSLSTAVSHIHPTEVLYILQAEVLLSNYFFHQDRRLEGEYHITAAVAIVLSSKLHQLGQASPSGSPRATDPSPLPPAADAIEQGERINAFWAVVTLDRCWSIALGAQSALGRTDMTRITTPWPLDMADYEKGLLPEAAGGRTLATFLRLENIDISTDSHSSKKVKAVVLFSEAVALAAQFSPEDPTYQAKFVDMNMRLEQYQRSLRGLLDKAKADADLGNVPIGTILKPFESRCILLIEALIFCAFVKLHTPLNQDWDINTSRTLSSALQAADLLQELDIQAVGYVDPFAGILLSIIAQVLIRALTIGRTLRGASSSNTLSEQELMIESALNRIFGAMEALTAMDPSASLMSRELRNLRQQRVMFHSP